MSSLASHPLQRLHALGLKLPAAPAAVGAYQPWQRVGNLVMTSFQLPWVEGRLALTGRLGEALSLQEGLQAARICALNGLAQLADAATDLARVRLVRLDGHIGCAEGFDAIPEVLNAASDLLNAVLGEQGRHARSALGHQVMPLQVPVMLGFWAELIDAPAAFSAPSAAS